MKKNILSTLLCLVFVFNYSISQTGFNVDVLPTNVGGKAEFKRVFEQELIYPESSLKKKKAAKVTVNFTVNKDSTVTDVIASESGAPDINIETMRIFKLFLWVPAIKNGEYVNSKWSVIFNFDPEKYSKICRERGFRKFAYPPKTAIDSSGVIYTKPEQYPIYAKGNYALQDFIKENLEYPRQAQLSNIQGTVMLSFVVEPSGLVTNIGVDKSLNGGCDQEAIRVLSLIKWYPGKNENKLVRVKMSFPFYFILNEEFRDNAAGEQK